MPRTIVEGFDEFHKKLKLIKTESELLASHRESIKRCLETNFGLKNFFRTGSIGHGTSIYGYSDVDYFASIPTNNLHKNSAYSLKKIKEALENRFPNTKGIHVNSPAVVIPFGNHASETTEVIPADYIKSENGFSIYDIPSPGGGWMRAGPTAHNEYVKKINLKRELFLKVKPLIRFIKAWKYYKKVPISSFYIEMRVAKYASKESSILYPIDIKYVFEEMLECELASMVDPIGISGYIESCTSEERKKDALSKLERAFTRAEKAVDAEDDGDTEDAFDWWDLVFDYKFPSYYY
ncbi:MAG: nucleotidyltransferase [Patescibacteria group bacterium]|jgi:hypothetical protein